MIVDELHQELDKVNLISLIIDSSNRKEQRRRRARALASGVANPKIGGEQNF